MLKNLILSAAAAGVAVGLFTAALQHVTTTPIILQAEAYEGGDGADADHHDEAASTNGQTIAVTGTHGDTDDAWAPADGAERTLYTSLSTVLIGVGFSLVLLAAMAIIGVPINVRSGLAFGVAGFAAVGLAPALGLPPEIPGSGAAAVEVRQIWWVFTALATAGGLAALLLTGRLAWQAAGIVLIAVPHIIGAPHPPAYASTAPAELAGHFVAASLVVSAVFWALLGSASGAVYQRIAQHE